MDQETKDYLDKKFSDVDQRQEAQRAAVRTQLQQRKRRILTFSFFYAIVIFAAIAVILSYLFSHLHK